METKGEASGPSLPRRVLKGCLVVAGWAIGLLLLLYAQENYPTETKVGAGLAVSVYLILKRFEHTEKMIESLQQDVKSLRAQLTLHRTDA